MSRTKPRQVVIVGAGLFGSIAAEICLQEGYDVTIIDDRRPESGSAPAACLMKPSWMSGLGRKMDVGMRVLKKLYGLKEIEFLVSGVAKQKVMWVPPSKILRFKPVREKVIHIGDGYVVTDKAKYDGFVLCAAGVWSFELLNVGLTMQNLTGSAILFKGTTEPEIRIWAPYKQAVWFNRKPNEVWFGDGTSILRKNFTGDHVIRSTNRALEYGVAGPSPHIKKVVIGQRPYIKGHKGVFKRVYNKTWISTGGAKNGTVLAAYQAYEFLEHINEF